MKNTYDVMTYNVMKYDIRELKACIEKKIQRKLQWRNFRTETKTLPDANAPMLSAVQFLLVNNYGDRNGGLFQLGC